MRGGLIKNQNKSSQLAKIKVFPVPSCCYFYDLTLLTSQFHVFVPVCVERPSATTDRFERFARPQSPSAFAAPRAGALA
jgi:hypothetical protein